MFEKAAGRPERIFDIVDEISLRRQEFWKMLVLVFIAAFALSLWAGILTAWLWEKYGNTWWIWVAPLVLFIACLVFAISQHKICINGRVHFELLFPMRKNDLLQPLKGEFYKPLYEYEERVRLLIANNSQEGKIIADEWKKFITGKSKTIEQRKNEKLPILLRFFIDLAEFFIFDNLVHHGNKSLTPKARYTRFGWIRPNYQPAKLDRDEDMASLKTNMFFEKTPDLVRRRLLFLPGFNFRRHQMTKQKKKDATYFEFISKYGSIRFTISPFPINMPSDSRDHQLISRYCGTFQDDTVAIKVPFVLDIDLRGRHVMRKQFSEMYASWIEDLVESVKHNLDWQHCAQYDLERMVVELLGRDV